MPDPTRLLSFTAATDASSLSSLEWMLIAAVVILLFIIWRLTRHQESEFCGEPEGGIEDLLSTLAGLTYGTATTGNTVDLIKGAEYFKSLCADIGAARHTVHFETFLWKPGKAADMVTEALCAAAKRGVKVRIMTDARGSAGLTAEAAARFRDEGCDFHRFHRWRIMNLGRFNIRDHRKIAVIDGKIAYVGGHCVTDNWLEDEEGGLPVYCDLTGRFTGPVVNQIQSCFVENWAEAGCDLFVDAQCFPENPPTENGFRAHVAYLRPDGCPSSVQVLHHVAISLAKKTIRIQNPYFLPDPLGVEALCKAARRGVDVRIMTPAVHATDSFFVTYAAHYLFQQLLDAGVRLFEYQPTLIHQKTITIDGAWAGIGSSNFDDRSFEINDEITVGICDANTVRELDDIFAHDEGDCKETTLENWRKRSLFARARARLFYLFNEQF